MNGREVPPRPNPYPDYTCIHAVYAVHQYGEEQEFWEGATAPSTPFSCLSQRHVTARMATRWSWSSPMTNSKT